MEGEVDDDDALSSPTRVGYHMHCSPPAASDRHVDPFPATLLALASVQKVNRVFLFTFLTAILLLSLVITWLFSFQAETPNKSIANHGGFSLLRQMTLDPTAQDSDLSLIGYFDEDLTAQNSDLSLIGNFNVDLTLHYLEKSVFIEDITTIGIFSAGVAAQILPPTDSASVIGTLATGTPTPF